MNRREPEVELKKDELDDTQIFKNDVTRDNLLLKDVESFEDHQIKNNVTSILSEGENERMVMTSS